MLFIALPMYNEGKNIGQLLQSIKDVFKNTSYKYKVLLVNDGSTDNSVEVVTKFAKTIPIIRVDHKVNMGLGKTLADVLKESGNRAKKGDIIITMDADNTHDPKYILQLIPKLLEGYDLVIASRFAKGGDQIGFPLHRKVLSWGARQVFRVMFYVKGISDYTSGYRAYRAELVKAYIAKYGDKMVESQGFQVIVEILVKLKKTGKLRVAEIPLVLRYDQKQGVSKMKLGRTILAYFKLMVQARFTK